MSRNAGQSSGLMWSRAFEAAVIASRALLQPRGEGVLTSFDYRLGGGGGPDRPLQKVGGDPHLDMYDGPVIKP